MVQCIAEAMFVHVAAGEGSWSWTPLYIFRLHQAGATAIGTRRDDVSRIVTAVVVNDTLMVIHSTAKAYL